MLTIFHGYSPEQLLIFQQLDFYCHLYLISIQTKLSPHVRQKCSKHIQWQRSKTRDDFLPFDEKTFQTNLIAYAQQCVSSMSKKILANKVHFLNATDPIQMVSIKFLEPESDIEQVLEFLPGLSVSIPCLMNAKNLDRQQNINIKVFISKRTKKK